MSENDSNSTKTTVKADRKLKEEFEKLFLELNGYQMNASQLLAKTLTEEISRMKKELSKKKK